MHQDAHEFLNFLLNTCAEILEQEARAAAEEGIAGRGVPARVGAVQSHKLRLGRQSRLTLLSSRSLSAGCREEKAARPTGAAGEQRRRPPPARQSLPISSPFSLKTRQGATERRSLQHITITHLAAANHARISAPQVRPDKTWVHDVFQGTLVNQTRCLWCETVRREQIFCLCRCVADWRSRVDCHAWKKATRKDSLTQRNTT